MYCIDAQQKVRVVAEDYAGLAGESLYQELPESMLQAFHDIQIQAEIMAQAQDALSRSDIQVLRCYEDGIPFPAEWVAYRRRLRDIGSGKTPGPVPERPAWP